MNITTNQVTDVAKAVYNGTAVSVKFGTYYMFGVAAVTGLAIGCVPTVLFCGTAILAAKGIPLISDSKKSD